MRRATGSRIVVALAVAGVAAAAFAVPATAQTHAKKHHLRYVAMGDSYSAASGNTPPDPSAAPQCLRSLINYPHLIAVKTHAKLHDVTCGGAEDKDYFSAQYQGVPAQLKAVHKKTQLVTMTIGGNDSAQTPEGTI